MKIKQNNLKVRWLVSLIIMLIFIPLVGVEVQESGPKTFQDYAREGREAHKKKDYDLYLEKIQKALSLRPHILALKYRLAGAYALTGRRKLALKTLKTVAENGLIYRVDQNKDFASVADSKEFKALLPQFEKNRTATSNSKIAFTIPQKDLIPEGITYNPKTGTFYVSSIYKRKIVQVTKDGKSSDFIKSGQDGFWGGVGMEVDVKRQVLWAIHGVGDQMMGYKAENEGQCAVSQYALRTGKLIKKYLLTDGKKHLLNDLTITSAGDVYITDSDFGALYCITRAKDRLELFLAPGKMVYPNGITLSRDEKYLYVAGMGGVSRVHLLRRTSERVTHPDNVTLTCMDGLYRYKNSLVGVQNYGGLDRVAQFHLDESGKNVTSMDVLEANHSLFIIPTTGVPVGDSFYYIANSQLTSFNADKTLFPMDKLREIVILKVPLN